MPIIQLTLLIIASALCCFGWAMIAYSGYASLRSWPVGAQYIASFSWLQCVAYLALIASLVFGYIAASWWGPLVVLLGGNVLARALLPITKVSTQLIAPVAVFLLSIACVVVWLLR